MKLAEGVDTDPLPQCKTKPLCSSITSVAKTFFTLFHLFI